MLKQCTDLAARELRSRCTVNAPCLTAISTLLTGKMKVCSWIICFRTDCSDIFCNTGLHSHWDVSFHRWHLFLMLNGKDTLLHILAWKRSVFCWEIESISINESHSSNGSHISTLHFAQTPAVLYLWTNRSLEETGPQAGWTGRGSSSGIDSGVSYLTCKKERFAGMCERYCKEWSHIIYFLLKYIVL